MFILNLFTKIKEAYVTREIRYSYHHIIEIINKIDKGK